MQLLSEVYIHGHYCHDKILPLVTSSNCLFSGRIIVRNALTRKEEQALDAEVFVYFCFSVFDIGSEL